VLGSTWFADVVDMSVVREVALVSEAARRRGYFASSYDLTLPSRMSSLTRSIVFVSTSK